MIHRLHRWPTSGYTIGCANDSANDYSSGRASWHKVQWLAILLLTLALTFVAAAPTAHAQAESQWVHDFASTQEIEIVAMSLSASGEVFIAGTFHGTVDFDPGDGERLLTSGASDTSFIAKYDPAGNLVWAYRLVGTGDVLINDLVVDPMAQVGVVGSFEGSADLDPGAGTFQVSSEGGHDIFLLRLLPDGNLQWGWAQGAGDDDMGFAVATDDRSGLYITGKFEGSIDFKAGDSLTYPHSSIGGTDIFAARFSNSGTLQWVSTFGGEEDDSGTDVGLDVARTVYVVGTFAGEADLDPLHTSFEVRSHGRDDIFLSVLTDIGRSLWQTYMGGTGNERNAQIFVEPDKSLYITGEFEESADFDVRGAGGELTSNGASDIFVTRFASNRDFQWAFAIGGSEPETLAAIDQDGFGNLYILGAFRGTVDFDPGDNTAELTSSGGADIFIARYTRQGQASKLAGMVNPEDDRARALAVSNNGNVVFAGEYSGSINLGSGLSISTGQPAGSYNAFVAHYARDVWISLPERAYLPGIIATEPAR